MSVLQLTFIVTVNMMGSGIIMLPTNMAKVGAISLLSWVVTAMGSMAIALRLRPGRPLQPAPGGMAAYAEDAYGKDGYFQVFFLYFSSLASPVAWRLGARFLSAFFPVQSSTPVATCIERHRPAVDHHVANSAARGITTHRRGGRCGA
jgi:putrescine:ornithine antiporter